MAKPSTKATRPKSRQMTDMIRVMKQSPMFIESHWSCVTPSRLNTPASPVLSPTEPMVGMMSSLTIP